MALQMQFPYTLYDMLDASLDALELLKDCCYAHIKVLNPFTLLDHSALMFRNRV